MVSIRCLPALLLVFLCGPNPGPAQDPPRATDDDAVVDQVLNARILQVISSKRLRDDAIDTIAAAEEEPLELKMARTIRLMVVGKSETITDDFVAQLLKLELLTHQAEAKSPDVLGKLLDARLNLGAVTYDGRDSVATARAIESASDLPNPTWSSEMVRLTCLIGRHTTKDLTDARKQVRDGISRVLPKYSKYASTLQEISKMVTRTGRSTKRAQAFNEAKKVAGCQ